MTMRREPGTVGTIPVGFPVVTQDGEKLGTVKETRGRCFQVDVPMAPDLWLPTAVVRSTDAQLVVLSIPQAAIGDYTVADPDAYRDWSEVSESYRSVWVARPDADQGRWEDYEPAYRYGYERRADPRYSDRRWDEVEPELQTDYPRWRKRRGYPPAATEWARTRDSVRGGWDRR
jgi:hypothetical protein